MDLFKTGKHYIHNNIKKPKVDLQENLIGC